MLASHGITAEIGMPPLSAHTITVPGAAAGWVDVVESFGSGKVQLILCSHNGWLLLVSM